MNFSKHKNKTIAEIAKKISDRYTNRGKDVFQQNAFDIEMASLQNKNEELKTKEEMKNGGKMKYADGGEIPYADVSSFNTNPLWGGIPYASGKFPMEQLTSKPVPPITQGQDNNSTPIGTVDNKMDVNTYRKNLWKDYLTPGVAGKSIETLTTMIPLFRGINKDPLLLNEQSDKVMDLMSNRNIDLTTLNNKATLASNTAFENTQNARSINTQRGLNQNVYNMLMGQFADNSLKEQQVNNDYRMQEAQTRQGLGTEKRSYKYQNMVDNLMNEANFFKGLQTVGASFGNMGEFGTKYRMNEMDKQMYQDMIATGDFEWNPEYTKWLESGQKGEKPNPLRKKN